MAAKQPVVPARVIGTRMAAAGKGNDADSASKPVHKKDMRWQRTERRIMRVFGDQLDQRPLNKISVTQLASEAEINKATFYLHYADIYELAIAYARASADEVVDGIEHPGAFFSDPGLFARELVAALGGEERFKKGRAFVDNGLSSVFADRLAARINEVLGGAGVPGIPRAIAVVSHVPRSRFDGPSAPISGRGPRSGSPDGSTRHRGAEEALTRQKGAPGARRIERCLSADTTIKKWCKVNKQTVTYRDCSPADFRLQQIADFIRP